jgi:hypothetical protein
MTWEEGPDDGEARGGDGPDEEDGDPRDGRRPLAPSLRAGVAIYNEGAHHEAHDAWEDYWLDLPDGEDERLLHGLIQFTAAVHHAVRRNWVGATGLAGSGRGYLADLPATYRGVDVEAVRQFLARLEHDPELVEREPLPVLTYGGAALRYDDLEFPAAAVVAGVFAEEGAEYDEGVVERAVAYAEADLDADEPSSPFVTLLLDFALAPDRRPVAYQRLSEHVERRDAREADVEGLFDQGNDG